MPDDEMKKALRSVVIAVLLGLLVTFMTYIGVRAQHPQESTSHEFVIIGWDVDTTGRVVLDYAVDGVFRTAFFPTTERAEEFIEYLKTRGTVDYLGIQGE